ncbi:MAG: class I adenylate-forming enzyme family protein [Coriobacteriia bacterium]|nr:class I adenylate-forming enzyme family protein [Coriobacteriia bacterium]
MTSPVHRCPLSEPRPVSLSHALAVGAIRHPSKDAVIFGDHVLSYRTLDGLVTKTAALLGTHHSASEHFASCLPRTPEFVQCFLASIRAGLRYVPIDPTLPPPSLVRLFSLFPPSFVVLEADDLERVDAALVQAGVRREARILVVNLGGSRRAGVECLEDAVKEASHRKLVEPDIDCGVYVNFTSGTTGEPKGVVATRGNIFWNVLGAVHELGLDHADRHLCCFPSHVHPHEIVARPVYLGGTIVLCPSQVNSIVEAIQDHGVTCMMANQAVYDLLRRHLGSRGRLGDQLRLAESGGSLTPPSLVEDYRQRWNLPLVPVWGSTETTGLALVCDSDRASSREPCIGRVARYFEARDTDENGLSLETGAAGALCLRGPAVVNGYVNASKRDVGRFADGWFETEDIVHVDAEGYFYFHGRTNDMIKSGGLKVYPMEVEAVLRSLPQVREAVVLGTPDSSRGEGILAFLVLRRGAELTEKGVIEACSRELEPHKVPRAIRFIPELPRTSAGKTDRSALLRLGS